MSFNLKPREIQNCQINSTHDEKNVTASPKTIIYNQQTKKYDDEYFVYLGGK